MEKYLTPEGLKQLKKELQYLKNVKRKEIAEKLAKSIAFGDLSENSEYQESKEAQSFLEGKIIELEGLIGSAKVVVADKGSKFAQVGSTVFVNSGSKKERFKIVGAEEANPLDGKISVDSPTGRAILNQIEGVVVKVNTPSGIVKYKILRIE